MGWVFVKYFAVDSVLTYSAIVELLNRRKPHLPRNARLFVYKDFASAVKLRFSR